MKQQLVSLVPLLMMWSCSGGAPRGSVGQPCSAMSPCTSPLVCLAELPGGYCTADCSLTPCGDGQTCGLINGVSLCLKPCQSMSDCRGDAYQCENAVCVPKCTNDADCGLGFQCGAGGLCTPYDGVAIGGSCGADSDCSSRYCVLGVCQQSCNRDAACVTSQTCALNVEGNAAPTPTTRIQPACTARRATAQPGVVCNSDGDCDRGACQLGICVELCANTPDCHGPAMTCTKMSVALDDGTSAKFQGCLPTVGTLSFPGDSGTLSLPERTRSFAIYVRGAIFNFNDFVGVFGLVDPNLMDVYKQPTTIAQFYALKVRYQPSESTSTMLVPNSPRVTILPGTYTFTPGSSLGSAIQTRNYVKLAPGPITTGTVPLNFYLTDLSGACKNVNVGNAATELSTTVDLIKHIYSQVGVTISTVTYQATTAPNVVRFQSAMGQPMLPDLDNVLEAATSNQATTVGLDVVLLRSINDQNGSPSNVLGIAGGIPASPVLGTPHSGVVVSIQTMCADNATLTGVTSGHELGHSVGLFHSQEQDGNRDPLTDTAADGMTNLMYWLESSGQHLSVEQGQVIRNDPKVQ